MFPLFTDSAEKAKEELLEYLKKQFTVQDGWVSHEISNEPREITMDDFDFLYSESDPN